MQSIKCEIRFSKATAIIGCFYVFKTPQPLTLQKQPVRQLFILYLQYNNKYIRIRTSGPQHRKQHR